MFEFDKMKENHIEEIITSFVWVAIGPLFIKTTTICLTQGSFVITVTHHLPQSSL